MIDFWLQEIWRKINKRIFTLTQELKTKQFSAEQRLAKLELKISELENRLIELELEQESN